jgi:uncharacterized protein YndB with AHSA1/START domain
MTNMVRVELDTVIKKSPEEVFERLTDISGYSKWMPKSGVFKKSQQTSKGPIGKGTTYVDVGRMGKWQGEITDFEKPKRVDYLETVRWFGLRVMQSRALYQLEPAEGTSKLHHVAEGQLYGIFKLMQPMAAVIARGERRRTVEALKRSLESTGT